MSGAAYKDRWVRRFTTDATHKHKNGFTIYKITSYLFPLASPEAVTVLTVWKRYSDLQMLQRAMKKMHQDLHLKGTCPVYTKWGYFRRFDPEVLEDRMKSTQALLEFIALHPPLFTSTDFVKFFQSSYPDPTLEDGTTGNIESIRRSLLLPVEVIGPLDNYQTSEDDSFSTVDSNSVSPMEGGSPDDQIIYRNDAGQPIAMYPKSTKEVSSRQVRGTLEDVAEVVVLPEPIAPKTITDVDSTSSENVENTSSSVDLNQTITNEINSIEKNVEDIENTINKNMAKLNLPDLLTFDSRLNMDVSQISSGSSSDSLSFLDSPSFNSNDVGKSSHKDTDFISFTKPSQSVLSLQDINSTANFNDSSHRNQSGTNGSLLMNRSITNGSSKDVVDSASFMSSSRSTSRMDTMSIDSLFGSTSDLQESYVFEAGYLLSLGARNEAKGEFQKAFDFYKAGIEKMLIGVQGDSNEFRRQFVRDKTNKYLSYAEKIYNNHLSNIDDNMLSEMSPTDPLSPPIQYPLKSCDVSSLCRPYEDLSKYRVLGIIGGQVMLVLCSETQNCYAMKVIQKTCNQIPDEDFFKSSSIDNQLPIMPTDIPYMVKLVAFVQTPNLLFLVMQYASGGKLFDYIKNYVKTVPETPNREVNLENVFIDPEEMNRKRNKSIHSKTNCLSAEEMIESNKQTDKKRLGIDDGKNIDVESALIDSNTPTSPDNLNLTVTDIVNNSQRLLSNVDDALNGRFVVKERDKSDCDNVRNGDDGVKNADVNCDSRVIRNRGGDGLLQDTDYNDLQEGISIMMDGDSVKFKIIGNRSALPPKSLCNWGAELLTAIDHLHQCGVYCRNLNPDNLLLGERGHLILSYMVGWSARQALMPLMNQGRLLGDMYIAPEMQRFPLLDDNYDQRLGDFWSFGVIMYELLTGLPLSLIHPTGFSSHTILNIPDGLSPDAESLLSQLLCYDPAERLGSGPNGIKDIKSHEYFKQIDWDHIQNLYDDSF